MPPKPSKTQQANVKTLAVELEMLSQEGGSLVPPDEFRIFRAGANKSRKGTFLLDAAALADVMAAAEEYGNELSIDYGHGMFSLFASDRAEAGKAAAWFKLDARDGELWAQDVRWTHAATQKLQAREFRYFSPAFGVDEQNRIKVLHNVALTNIPALHTLEPLMASQGFDPEDEPEEQPMKTLLKLLGLPETATEAEAMAALSSFQAPFTELLSLTGKPTPSDALGVVKAWKVAADSVPAMHKELSQIKASQEEAERSALLAEGSRRGVVPPAYVPVLKTMELSQLKEFLKVAVPVHPKPGAPSSDTTLHTVALTAEDRSVAQMLGVSEADFAKRKAARGGVVPMELPASTKADA